MDFCLMQVLSDVCVCVIAFKIMYFSIPALFMMWVYGGYFPAHCVVLPYTVEVLEGGVYMRFWDGTFHPPRN